MKFGKKSATLSKKFGSNPVYKEKCINTEIKSYNKNVNTDFPGKNIPKESSEYICLSVIFLDSVCRKENKYYP